MKKFVFTLAFICILFFGGTYIFNSFQIINQNKDILKFLNSVNASANTLSFSQPSNEGNFSFNIPSQDNSNEEQSIPQQENIQQSNNSINNNEPSNSNSSSNGQPNSNSNSNGQLIFPEGNINVNGITLSNTLKGNSEINQAAQKITANCDSPLKKAEALYVWVAYNITYNNAYAKDVTNGIFPPGMGTAIDTFNSKQAICSGFASLYFVMAKDVGLNVRLVSGKGLGDKYSNTWGNHMWNEVYINNQWLPVDTTFANSYTVAMKKLGFTPELKGYLSNENTVINKLNGFNMETYTIPAADFFNPSNFYSTHKDPQVVATWIN